MAQQGTVFERNGSWYLQYWRTDFKHGQNVRRRVTERLVGRSEQYRSRKDVLTGCAKQINNILEPINTRRHQPESSLTIAQFVEERFLEHLKEKIALGYRKPSLLKFHSDVFKNHLKNTVGGIALRDFTTLDAQNLFDEIDRTKTLAHASIQRIQSSLSAIFTYAKQRNLVPFNPVRETRVEGKRTKPKRYAYSLAEVLAMISKLQGRAATVIAVAGFTGLRHGEIRGLQWQDYDGE